MATDTDDKMVHQLKVLEELCSAKMEQISIYQEMIDVRRREVELLKAEIALRKSGLSSCNLIQPYDCQVDE